jgi:hypothetical protein
VLLKESEQGDYIALLALVERNDANAQRLQRVRIVLRDDRVATTLGFGPPYPHSTGPAQKWGRPRGDPPPQLHSAS